MVCSLRMWYCEEPNTCNIRVCSYWRYVMEQNKSNTGLKFEEVVLWGSGSQSYFRSLSVTVIPWGVTVKLTVVNLIAAFSVDKRSVVRCIALAPVSILTSHFPIHQLINCKSKKQKKQISELKLLPKFDKQCNPGHKWEAIRRNFSKDGAIQQYGAYISEWGGGGGGNRLLKKRLCGEAPPREIFTKKVPLSHTLFRT